MFEQRNFSKACSEVIEILNYVPKEDYDKIPKYIVDGFNDNRDINYNYDISNYYKDIMMYETQVILAVLFRDYWGTQEQREKIEKYEKYKLQLIEKDKSKQYNSSKLFKKETKQEDIKSANESTLLVVNNKESFFSKLINKIKYFFRIK